MTAVHFLRIVRLRLRSILRPRQLDDELSRELTFHLEALTEEHVAEGLPPAEARAAARRAVGNLALLEEQCRDQRRVGWLHDLRQDAAYGLRMLRRQPGFTATALISLAIGIGSASAVLGAIDRVLFDPLAVTDADRLVCIRTIALDRPDQLLDASLPDVVAWRDRARSFASIGTSLADQRTLAALQDGAPPERIRGRLVTPSFFTTLGVRPVRGRLFTESEGEFGRLAPVVVISHRLWQERFGGDPGILDTSVRIGNGDLTIVGVMPPDFRYPDGSADYWIPFGVNPRPQQGSARFFITVARLAPGVTIAQAQADLDSIAARLAAEVPERHRGWGVRLQPVRETLYGWTARPLLTLAAAVLSLLAIACANVAGLLLARGAVRQREMALRLALGAGRGRVVRQVLTESLLLSAIGGVLGLFVAWIALRSLSALGPPPGAPPIGDLTLDMRVFAVNAMLAIVSAACFGLAPALAATRTPAIGPIAQAGPTGRLIPWRRVLVAAQVAVTLVLLVIAGLMLNSFVRLSWRELNLDPAGVLTFEYRMPPAGYAKAIGAYQEWPYFEVSPLPAQTIGRIHERLAALPGVQQAGGISYAPINALVLPELAVVLDRPGAAGTSPPLPNARYFLVTPGWFATVRAPIVRGRDFTDADGGSSRWVAVINETAARLYWPGEDPIGRRLTLQIVPDERPREVIGIVGDIPVRRRSSVQEPVVYASYLQQPARYRAPWTGMFGQMTFMLRHSSAAQQLAPAARRAVADIDPRNPVASVMTLDAQLGVQLRGMEPYVAVLGAFAATALLLASVGIYGVMAFLVCQRTAEIGVRKALGAGGREVVSFVGRPAAIVVAVGLAAGVLGSLLMAKLIESQLWGVTGTDPATIGAMALLIAAVAALACAVPARRALAVDPTVALRND